MASRSLQANYGAFARSLDVADVRTDTHSQMTTNLREEMMVNEMQMARTRGMSGSRALAIGLAMTLSVGLVGCLRKKAPAAAAPPPSSAPATTPSSSSKDYSAVMALPSLAKKFEADFDIGTAVEPQHLVDMPQVLTHHFNRLTAENQMKLGPLCQTRACNYAKADQIADFARQHGLRMSGHTFVWHQMQPGWFFQESGKPTTKEIVDQRLKDHVFEMTKRYADVVDNWDVVNEAISDSSGKTYRDGDEGSPWFKAYGGQEYIKAAFQHAAAAAAAHDPTVKLYYNDYNIVIPEKRKKVIEMVRWLRSQGVRVDGVGEQGHWNLEWPSAAEIAATIDELAAENLEVKISELDVNIYSKDDHATKTWQPEMEFTPELQQKLAARYAEIFKVLREKGAALTQVTLWGISDDRTWLNTWPLSRRNDPLLLDRNHQPKAAFKAILEL